MNAERKRDRWNRRTTIIFHEMIKFKVKWITETSIINSLMFCVAASHALRDARCWIIVKLGLAPAYT